MMASSLSSSRASKRPRVTEKVQNILGWPTDTVSIDFYGTPHRGARDAADAYYKDEQIQHYPHTLLLFIAGNPGLVSWYKPLLEELVEELGVGYAARGLSHAGHGLNRDVVDVERWEKQTRNTRIPWALDGQIEHKLAWMDEINQEMKELGRAWSTRRKNRARLPTFIFLSHSIGSFMVQRLCILRQQDVLANTLLLIHLMPFIRMDAPQPQKTVLSFAAHHQDVVIAFFRSIFRLASRVPESWVNTFLRNRVKDEEGRRIAVSLIRQPTFARNFFEMGCDELRSVGVLHDASGLRLVGKHCDTVMLYCGGPDQWGPYEHVQELEEWKQQGIIPDNISITYMDELRHDFVVRPHMVPPVKAFCLEAIRKAAEKDTAKVQVSRL